MGVCYLVASYWVWVIQHPLFKNAWWNPMTILITGFVTLFEAGAHPWQFLRHLWNPQPAVWIGLGVLTCIGVACTFEFRRLAKGGAAVAENTPVPGEKYLCNVVAEMGIAAGLPAPRIFVLDRESGINAFAAGHTTCDVAIGVTYGCITLLTREELQGLIAHEFSHVLDGDTRLNMRLMALAYGLFWRDDCSAGVALRQLAPGPTTKRIGTIRTAENHFAVTTT